VIVDYTKREGPVQRYTRKETVMSEDTTRFVGMDVHKDTIVVAVASLGQEQIESWGSFSNDAAGVRKLLARLGPLEWVFCTYEAGPTGYALLRQLQALGVNCSVTAPSLIPVKPGDRVKTDRRDAIKLARLLRAGELTSVWVPDAATEALRDLTRARQAAQQQVVEAKNQLGKFLLRLAVAPPAAVRPWSNGYHSWLRQLRLPNAVQQLVLDEARAAVAETAARVSRLEGALRTAPLAPEQSAAIAALQSMRGIALITATALVAEIGDCSRFARPRQLMAYAGVVPSEHSSGGRVRRGSITKSGNAHLRGVVVEAAQHYRHKPHVGWQLQARQRGQAAPVLGIAAKAQQRLYRRYWHLVGKNGKSSQQAIVAVARELLGFIWAVGQEVVAAGAATGSAAA
jgi:transposase